MESKAAKYCYDNYKNLQKISENYKKETNKILSSLDEKLEMSQLIADIEDLGVEKFENQKKRSINIWNIVHNILYHHDDVMETYSDRLHVSIFKLRDMKRSPPEDFNLDSENLALLRKTKRELFQNKIKLKRTIRNTFNVTSDLFEILVKLLGHSEEYSNFLISVGKQILPLSLQKKERDDDEMDDEMEVEERSRDKYFAKKGIEFDRTSAEDILDDVIEMSQVLEDLLLEKILDRFLLFFNDSSDIILYWTALINITQNMTKIKREYLNLLKIFSGNVKWIDLGNGITFRNFGKETLKSMMEHFSCDESFSISECSRKISIEEKLAPTRIWIVQEIIRCIHKNFNKENAKDFYSVTYSLDEEAIDDMDSDDVLELGNCVIELLHPIRYQVDQFVAAVASKSGNDQVIAREMVYSTFRNFDLESDLLEFHKIISE